MKRADIPLLMDRFQADNPHPRTELVYNTPFQLLMAVLLSAQATDAGVNRATAPLFEHIREPQDVLDRGLPALTQAVSSLNFYKTKAQHLWTTCERLVRDHGGAVPADRAALEALPGVGRKTANVVLNVVFHQPVMPVDTHIFRVAKRLGLARGSTPLAVETELMRRIPAVYRVHAHHWLILHGRYVCKARTPQCGACRVNDLCDHGRRRPLQWERSL